MPGDRLLRILRQLRPRDDEQTEAARLCEMCAEILSVTGAGVMLMSGDVPRGAVCSSDDVSTLIEDLQFTLGEGPCVDAYHHDRPMLEPDLAAPSVERWMAFAGPAVAAGARAVFGFPLQIGSIRLGALNLYRDAPGPLTDDQFADALVVSSVIARAVLEFEAHTPPGSIPREMEAGSDFRFVVHQASGMASVQLQIGVAEALIRLRAYAFAHERPLNDVAEDVVARRLRIE